MTSTVLVLLGVLLYGAPIARALEPRLRGAALAGASFLLGIGTVALHMFALSVAGIAWTRTSVLLSIAPLLILAMVVAAKRRRQSGGDEEWSRPVSAGPSTPLWMTRTGGVFDVLTVLAIVSYAIFALWAPPFEWDFYGIWGLKGRWFFEARGVDWAWLRANVAQSDYPPLVPLMFDFVAVVTGHWNDAAFGWVYVALGAALIAVFRGFSSPAATLAVAFPALNVWVGLADAAVMAYGCAGVLLLRAGATRTGAIFLGLAAWSKNEGLAWILTAAVALLIATRSVRKVAAFWPAAVLIAPWLIALRVLDLQSYLAKGSAVKRVFEHLGDPVKTVKALASAPPDQPYFWLVVLAIVLIFLRDAIQQERFLLLAVLLQAAALVLPLLATPFDLAGHATFSLNRVPHQIAPVAAFLAAVLVLRRMEVAQSP